MPSRMFSEKIEASGICPGALVARGYDWQSKEDGEYIHSSVPNFCKLSPMLAHGVN